ncbi:TPA: hypothetical protein DEB00_01170 [Candidatus Uhrbacteria bacterium]|nr:hypothetical protein [Candidatus Uhrbacteria bacterium]
MYNAYILERTMDEYNSLKTELSQAEFVLEKEKDDEDIMVMVDYGRVDAFADIVQKHLNEPFNYVDCQFPEQGLTVLIFLNKMVTIDNEQTNQKVKQWALSIGLSEKEADWPTSYSYGA